MGRGLTRVKNEVSRSKKVFVFGKPIDGNSERVILYIGTVLL